MKTCSASGCQRPTHTRGMCSLHYKRATSTRPESQTRDMTDDERFDHYTTPGFADCVLWTGACGNPPRYGFFWHKGKNVLAHRYAFERHHRPLLPGEFACHRCDVPLCVNPDHLFAGASADNQADMSAKGRVARGERQHLAKLTQADVEYIRASTLPGIELAKAIGVSNNTISRVRRRLTWDHVA